MSRLRRRLLFGWLLDCDSIAPTEHTNDSLRARGWASAAQRSRGSVKDVLGHPVKDVMGLNKRKPGWGTRPWIL